MQARTRSGLQIHFDEAGRGEPALLLLPGWCTSRAVYRELVPLLASRHRVLSLDWRGHGDSDRPADDFGTAALTADALAVVDASLARTMVPVALAQAGWVAVALRRLLGPRVPRLVLLDWLVLEAPPAFRRTLDDLQSEPLWEKARETLFAAWRGDSAEPAVARFLEAEGARHGFDMWARAARAIVDSYEQAGSPLRALSRLDPQVPTLHLYSQPADRVYAEAQGFFVRRHDWFEVARLEGRSHFPMLENPEATARAIEEFLTAPTLKPAAELSARDLVGALPTGS